MESFPSVIDNLFSRREKNPGVVDFCPRRSGFSNQKNSSGLLLDSLENRTTRHNEDLIWRPPSTSQYTIDVTKEKFGGGP